MAERKEYPALLCLQCFREMNQADSFRKKCLEADEYFRSLKISQDVSTVTENKTTSDGLVYEEFKIEQCDMIITRTSNNFSSESFTDSLEPTKRTTKKKVADSSKVSSRRKQTTKL